MKHYVPEFYIDVNAKVWINFWNQCMVEYNKAKAEGWEPAYDGPEKEPDEN